MTPPGPIDRVLGAIVPRAVGAVDIDEIVGQVDVNHLVSEVDVDAIVARVDVNAVVERVDIDGLMGRVDIEALLTRVDLNGLMGRIDLNGLMGQIDLDTLLTKVDLNTLLEHVDLEVILAKIDLNTLIGRLDVDTLMARIDLDALLARVDIEALMRRAKIDEIVSNASRGVSTRLLDSVRRQLVGLDLLLIGLVTRVFRRPGEQASIISGTVTGQVAGAISRLAAFLVDASVISVSYGLIVALAVFMAGLFAGEKVDLSNHSAAWLTGYIVVGFLYYWVGLSITGRSIGKGLLGLRVVAKDGSPINPGRAAVRTIAYPFSFILGLGLTPIVIGKQRRALHDFVAGDKVLYDWGDRPAELPPPLTDWVRRHTAVAAASSYGDASLAPLTPAPLINPAVNGTSAANGSTSPVAGVQPADAAP